MTLFHHKLELDSPSLCQVRVVDSRFPEVAIGPLGLDPSFTVVLLRIPVAKEFCGANQPQVLSIARLVVHTNQDLLELNLILAIRHLAFGIRSHEPGAFHLIDIREYPIKY